MEESPFDWDQAAAAVGEDGTDLYTLSELLSHHQLTATTTTTTTTTTAAAAAATEDLHLPHHQQHHNQGAFAVWWIAPEVPCGQCSQGGLECRVIRTDDQTSFCCTSCVGLGWECSFADVPPQPMAPQPDMMMMTDAAAASSDWGLSELADTPLDPSGPHLGASDADMDLIRGMAWSGRPSTPAAMGGTHAHAYVPGHAYAPAPALSADQAPEPGPDLLDSSAAPVSKATGGARFSRESVKILKGWLASHSRHPYPTEQEKDGLIRQTGLSKIQISNWFVNARRRGKIQPPRSTSPMPSSWRVGAMDIPARRTNTPAPMEHMNPLERWAHSPPENEPASATDIARALSASCASLNPDLDSPFPSSSYVDDGSGRSLFNGSSASSAGASTSLSSRSSYSQASRGSFRSALSALSHGSGSGRCEESRRSRRRRRKSAHRRSDSAGDVAAASAAAVAQAEPGSASRPFQCTFCIEAFRTKHDWQRHEKSLHLSLERWVCTLEGPRCARPGSSHSESIVGNTSTGVAAATVAAATAAPACACVFCGEPDPTDDHIETHNYSVCRDKDAPERVFYRKDHLNQHLRLVHNVRYIDWAMKRWKIASTEIRSRCGFCGSVLDSWNSRIDHLAEHFKTGSSMREWKGDWGFEAPVLKMVENSILPERTSEEDRAGGSGSTLQHGRRLRQHGNNSGTAPAPPPESPRNAFELIKLEMAYYRSNYHSEQNNLPSDDAMQVEACRIIFASEVLSMQGIASELSWLRDLIMGNNELMQQARFGPLRSQAESRLTTLKVSGKDNLFEKCPLEQALADWVREKSLLGLCAMDHELQQVACVILGRVDEQSAIPDDAVSNWLVRLVLRSTHWLAPFRQRAHLPRSEDLKDELFRSSDPSTIDSTVLSYGRLESELAAYLIGRRRDHAAAEPTDDELQRRARVIIYGNDDDGWNQTAADDEVWLAGFRSRHPPVGAGDHPNRAAVSANEGGGSALPPLLLLPRLPVPPPGGQGGAKGARGDAAARERTLVQDLRRFVLACMSLNSPSQHIPTDRELQHQARWILYDCDDPGNRTPADNTEWLRRFKVEVGMPLSRGEAVADLTSHQPSAGQIGGAGEPGPVGLLDPLLPLLPPLLMADSSANPAAVPGFDVGSIDDFMDEDIFGLEELI